MIVDDVEYKFDASRVQMDSPRLAQKKLEKAKGAIQTENYSGSPQILVSRFTISQE
jgi:hypothetical protein